MGKQDRGKRAAFNMMVLLRGRRGDHAASLKCVVLVKGPHSPCLSCLIPAKSPSQDSLVRCIVLCDVNGVLMSELMKIILFISLMALDQKNMSVGDFQECRCWVGLVLAVCQLSLRLWNESS